MQITSFAYKQLHKNPPPVLPQNPVCGSDIYLSERESIQELDLAEDAAIRIEGFARENGKPAALW